MQKTNRRQFVKTTAKAAVLTTLATPLVNIACGAKNESGEQSGAVASAFAFTQLKLPYDYAALEPSIDAQTMDIHYNKHHTAYIKNVNEAIETEKITVATEIDFFTNISKLSAKARNNGGGAWNHNFFWEIMKPNSADPTGKVVDAINGAFGSFESFKEKFTQAAMTRFGSGWAWLVNDNGILKIGSTPNQDNPLMDVSEFRGKPLLALDVWEHAYYLKYQNKRNEYVENWWKIINWDVVASKL